VRTRPQLAGSDERADHRVGDDHHVAGLTRQQCLAHRADGTEAAFDARAALVGEALLQRVHHALRRAGTEQLQ